MELFGNWVETTYWFGGIITTSVGDMCNIFHEYDGDHVFWWSYVCSYEVYPLSMEIMVSLDAVIVTFIIFSFSNHTQSEMRNKQRQTFKKA